MGASTTPAQNAAPTAGKRTPVASPSPLAKKEPLPTATTANGTHPLSEKQIKLLEGRGIDVELAVRMGWRSGKEGGSGDWIEIPYFRNGKEVNYKARTLGTKKEFYQSTGAEKCLFNVDCLREVGDMPLVITEGEMDCLIAIQCGFKSVSVPDGAPAEKIQDMDARKYEYLSDITKEHKLIIIATDGDAPGANLLHDLSLRLGKYRCKWIKYPKGAKDLNDVFMQWGKRGVDQTIERAQYVKIEGLHKLSTLPPAPQPESYHVGIDPLREHFRIRRGDFSVVTGIPSHGKTAVTNAISFNMAHIHGWNICYASFEQKPQTEHRRAIRTLYSDRPEHLQTPEEHEAADKWIEDKFSFIIPDEDEECNMEWLMERMAAAVTRFNATMIIIDPWNELDHVFNQREMSGTQYVGKAIKALKKFAQKYMVHVMVVAHPAKIQKNKDNTYPVPTAYDISDSAHWYNKPDQILIVHRQTADQTLLRIAKSRYHYILGKPGDVEVRFDDYTYKFS